jgi:hypothetical protein
MNESTINPITLTQEQARHMILLLQDFRAEWAKSLIDTIGEAMPEPESWFARIFINLPKYEQGSSVHRDPMELDDGLTMSIQASARHYAAPKDNMGPYTEYEVGFPSQRVEELMPYAEDASDPTKTVYGWVPTEVIETIFAARGWSQYHHYLPAEVLAELVGSTDDEGDPDAEPEASQRPKWHAKPGLVWVHVNDMHSGGGTKEDFEGVYIECESEEQAAVIFYNRFGHSPHRVSCTCCGADYSIYDEGTDLMRATGFARGCRIINSPEGDHVNRLIEPEDEIPEGWTLDPYQSRASYMTMEAYAAKEDILILRDEDIDPEHKTGSVPRQGYVWAE